MTTATMLTRDEKIAALTARDGYRCMYPGCEEAGFGEGKWLLTLDHVNPQSEMRAAGFTEDEINSLDNLQLMHRVCNSKKADFKYDEHGNLPVMEPRVKADKSNRVEVCNLCMSGRNLIGDQTCGLCGSVAQPISWPTYLKRKVNECDHAKYHCYSCITGLVTRKQVSLILVEGPA